MTKNSQALANLVKSAESIKRENERLTSEIIAQSLDELNKNLTTTFNTKLDSTLKEMRERNKEPLAIRLKNLAIPCGFTALIMLILCGIAWNLWIRPYQIPKERTTLDAKGRLFIEIDKTLATEYNGKLYIPLY